MPQDSDVVGLVNEVLSRVLGATFLALCVALCLALLAIGTMGVLRTWHHRPRLG